MCFSDNRSGEFPGMQLRQADYLIIHELPPMNNLTPLSSVLWSELMLLVCPDMESFTLLQHMRPSPDFSGVCVARSAVFCVVFCRSLFVPLSFFLLTIVVSVLLRFVDSDYLFGIFKLFLHLKMTFRLLVFFSKGIQCIQFDWTMNKL